MKGHEIDIEQYRITEEPFYEEINGEIGLADIAAQQHLPVMLKGPDGLRQDPLRATPGLPAEASADHGGLP